MDYKIELKDAVKQYTFDQDKILSPDQTVKKFKQKAAMLDLDILNRTSRIDNGRLDIPVFFSECGHDARQVIGTNKQMGKGGTPDQAEASAVMELAERFSFFSFMNNPENFISAPSSEIGKDALPYDQIIKSVNDNEKDALKIKPVFDSLPFQWTKAYNLTKGNGILLPFNWFYMINEFNGPSAGNCIEEAVCQGICEVIERHACAVVSQEKIKVPGIRLDTFSDPLVKELLEKYRKNSIRVYASDFTLDTGIPTIAVLAWDPSTFPEKSEIVWTAGTSPDPQKAMSRALTETAQLAGDFNSGSNFVASGLPKFTHINQADFITNPEKMIHAGDLPDISDINIQKEIQHLCSRLSEKNLDVHLVDITHRGLEIPAFYSIIPGARFRERAAETSVGMFSARFITENFYPALALDRLDQIEKLLPDKYYTSFYKGLSWLNLGQPQQAVELFEKSLEQEPSRMNMPDICSYMGSALKDLEKFDRAEEILIKGLEIDEQRTDILNLIGFCCFKKKEFLKAADMFQKAVQIDPSLAINYANIGSCYRDMGNREAAIKYYSTALEIDPSIEFAKQSLEKLKN